MVIVIVIVVVVVVVVVEVEAAVVIVTAILIVSFIRKVFTHLAHNCSHEGSLWRGGKFTTHAFQVTAINTSFGASLLGVVVQRSHDIIIRLASCLRSRSAQSLRSRCPRDCCAQR